MGAGINTSQLSLQVRQNTDWAVFGGLWRTDQEKLLLPGLSADDAMSGMLNSLGSTFGYVEKPERVQQVATKIVNIEAAGLVLSGEGVVKGQSNSNLQLLERELQK